MCSKYVSIKWLAWVWQFEQTFVQEAQGSSLESAIDRAREGMKHTDKECTKFCEGYKFSQGMISVVTTMEARSL